MYGACTGQERQGRSDSAGGLREMEGYKLDILRISMVLDWACPEERSEQRQCCCPWMEARGEEKQRQTQNNLASHSREGERQTRMELMGNSKTGSKQPQAVEGGCSGLVRLAKRFNFNY